MNKTEIKILLNTLKNTGEQFIFIGTVEENVAAALSGNFEDVLFILSEVAKQDKFIRELIFKSWLEIIKDKRIKKGSEAQFKQTFKMLIMENKEIYEVVKEIFSESVIESPEFNLN